MKFLFTFLVLFLVNGLGAQIINSQPSVLYGKKYYVDNERISKKDFVNLISEDRRAGELYMLSRSASRKKVLFSIIQVGGAIASVYQVSRWNLTAAYKILAGSYLAVFGTLYYTEISENKFREAIPAYNQGLLEASGTR